MPKISVIIPVYNVEPYLRECLDSVRAQTFTDWECICVDDGSTDASPAILDEYAAKDPRFRIFRREHSNAGACRNVGMDLAKGEYLQFLDSDDVFAPRMIGTMVGVIEQHQADMASCTIVRFRDGEDIPSMRCSKHREIRVYNEPSKTVDTFSTWIGRPWDKMFRKRFIDGLGIRFQEIRSTNDEFFIDLAVVSAHRIVHIDEPLIAYRQHASSLQATQHKDPLCLIKAIDAVYSEMERRGMFSDNPSLFLHFRTWVARSSRQLQRINSADAYEVLHRELHHRCKMFRLGELTREETNLSEPDYALFKSLSSSISHSETLLCEIQQLRNEVNNLRPLRGIDRTYAYRIGSAIMWFPKRVKKLFWYP